MPVVFMFPGQSSRYPGLLPKLAALSERNAALLDTASKLIGRDLGEHYRADNPEAFARNTDVQLGVFVANHMFLQLLQDAGVDAQLSLGLSLGEWNHLVHIGALEFDEALMAVQERGAAYDAGPRGAMASVFPMELDELQEVVDQARDVGLLEIVNLNSPRQQVLSGERAALDKALAILERDHFCEATIIEKQVPMHSSLFAPVADRFASYLSQLSFGKPRLPYFPNRLAQLIAEPTKDQYVELLSSHVSNPVLWRASIDVVLANHPDAVLVEVGPKRVLFNLIDKKWHRGISKLHMDSVEDTGAHIAQVLEQVRAKTAA